VFTIKEQRRDAVADLKPISVAPKGRGLRDFVAQHEGFFAAAGLEVQFDWKTFRGTQSSWKDLSYFERPQDKPFVEGRDVIQGACVWGSICNARASMGRFVPDAYGDSPSASSTNPFRALNSTKSWNRLSVGGWINI
jgi:hypothetical protein